MREISVELATNVLWAAWYATWIAAVAWQARTKTQLKTDIRSLPRVLMGIGSILLFFLPSGSGDPVFGSRFLGWTITKLWSNPHWLAWSLFGAIIASFCFCWWARLHLGRLWSGYVTVKDDHRIVDTGPYGLVRHPIYAGVMFAALMTGFIKASPATLAGAAFVIVGISMIARIEERFLSEQLGADAYSAYRRKVGMLVPLLK